MWEMGVGSGGGMWVQVGVCGFKWGGGGYVSSGEGFSGGSGANGQTLPAPSAHGF